MSSALTLESLDLSTFGDMSRVEIRREPLKALSLFSNCGAGDLGYSHGGFSFLVLAELEPHRLGVALRNHLSAYGVPGDLRQSWPIATQIFEIASKFDRPDLLAACPPCQGMSTARSGRGCELDPDAGSKDPRNLLVLPIYEAAVRLKPRIIVIENVPAFLSRRIRSPLDGHAISAAALLSRLLEKDYAVYPFLTDLADFGVPQTRKRAFLTFVRQDEPCLQAIIRDKVFPYPIPSLSEDYGGEGPVPLKNALNELRLHSLDACSRETSRDPKFKLHRVPVWEERQYRMIAEIAPNSGKSAWDNQACLECGKVIVKAEDALCPACGNPLLRPVVKSDNGYRLIRGFRRSSYRRLNPDEPAATITTASGRVGSDRTIHPSENRVLSILECALLQTFPRSFDWGHTYDLRGDMSIRAMIGEAVPPLFTFLHGSVLKQLLVDSSTHGLIPARDTRCRGAVKKLESGAK